MVLGDVIQAVHLHRITMKQTKDYLFQRQICSHPGFLPLVWPERLQVEYGSIPLSATTTKDIIKLLIIVVESCLTLTPLLESCSALPDNQEHNEKEEKQKANMDESVAIARVYSNICCENLSRTKHA